MRSTNGPMDVITRAEFEERMADVVTKDFLTGALAENRTEILNETKTALAVTKAEILSVVDTRLYRMQSEINVSTSMRLTETKAEILAVTRKNLDDAVAPLAQRLGGVETRLDSVETRLDGVEKRLGGVETRVGSLETKVESLETKMDARFNHLGTLMESVRDDVKLIAEAHVSTNNKLDSTIDELRQMRALHERRLDAHDALFYKLKQSGTLS